MPFIVQKTDSQKNVTPQYIVLTGPIAQDKTTQIIEQYLRVHAQKGIRILLFDASLGLGEMMTLYPSLSFVSPDAVLQKAQALSTLIVHSNNLDIISGSSKTTDLGQCNEYQLLDILQDLKLLGTNYQQIIIYAPATLPTVQKFFCDQLNSICITLPDEQHIASASKLISDYPKMKCYIVSDSTNILPQAVIQLGLMIPQAKILTKLPE